MGLAFLVQDAVGTEQVLGLVEHGQRFLAGGGLVFSRQGNVQIGPEDRQIEQIGLNLLIGFGFGLRPQALANQTGAFPEMPAVGLHAARFPGRERRRPVIGTKALDQETEFLDRLSAFRESKLVAQLVRQILGQWDRLRQGQPPLEGTPGFSQAVVDQVVAAFAQGEPGMLKLAIGLGQEIDAGNGHGQQQADQGEGRWPPPRPACFRVNFSVFPLKDTFSSATSPPRAP